MRIIAITLAAAFSCAAISGAAWAHHGWTSYDTSKHTKITGTLTALKWEMPHPLLSVDSKGKKYDLQLPHIQRIIDRGLAREALSNGKTVMVEAQPHKEKADDWQVVAITVDNYEYSMTR